MPINHPDKLKSIQKQMQELCLNNQNHTTHARLLRDTLDNLDYLCSIVRAEQAEAQRQAERQAEEAQRGIPADDPPQFATFGVKGCPE